MGKKYKNRSRSRSNNRSRSRSSSRSTSRKRSINNSKRRDTKDLKNHKKPKIDKNIIIEASNQMYLLFLIRNYKPKQIETQNLTEEELLLKTIGFSEFETTKVNKYNLE
jgi:hypothetical protein